MSYDLINCCLVSCIRLNFIYIYIYLLEPVHLSDTVGSFFSYHLYTWITFYYRILLPPGGSFESSLTVPVVIVLLFFEALERHCTLFLQLVISEIHTVQFTFYPFILYIFQLPRVGWHFLAVFRINILWIRIRPKILIWIRIKKTPESGSGTKLFLNTAWNYCNIKLFYNYNLKGFPVKRGKKK